VAGPVRFRVSTEPWDEARVRRDLLKPLDDRFGARLVDPEIPPPPEFAAARIEMDNGDLALFAWNGRAYWLGNTETPEALWRTDKETFEEAPFALSRWAQRELLADLEREESWVAEFDYLAWFFLPVLVSKDGRDTTRDFFRDDASGFPDATREAGLAFYEEFLKTGVLEAHRYTMAAKLGTSEYNDLGRMRATMGEFDAAKLLTEAGYEVVPEVERDSGHALDFLVDGVLVEVTRPLAPRNRSAGTAVSALRQTAQSKTGDQLAAHGDALLLVDCTSFTDEDWNSIRSEKPDLAHEPAVVFRYRPDGHCEGYRYGDVPLWFGDAIEWV